MNEISAFDVGMVCYLGGLAGLTLWEDRVAPRLKKQGIIPDVPLIEGDITEAQRDLKWMTPLTCDQHLPLPSLEMLREKGVHRIGSIGGIHQMITLAPPKTYPLQVTTSPEWSSHYNTTVYIYKQRIK